MDALLVCSSKSTRSLLHSSSSAISQQHSSSLATHKPSTLKLAEPPIQHPLIAEAMLRRRDEGDTPSRYELLSMVRKHSNLLGKTTVDEEDSSDIEMDSGFWHHVMDLYFVRSKESRGRQDDDLVFFVRKLGLQGYGFNDNMERDAPYFVRRWAPKMEKLVGENYAEVDWRRTFYLNLIVHTTFSVTVAICSYEDLRNHQDGKNTPLSPIYKVVKTVYASPSRVNFHLDSNKEVETTAAYPDISFAVDDFDSSFDAVLSETDHCYCVILNGHEGAAFPSEKATQDSCTSNTFSLKIDTKSGSTRNTKLVSPDLGAFFHLVSPLAKQRLYMKGPAGRGEVEVAVSGVEDQSQVESGPFSPVTPMTGFGIGSIVRKAASVASVAAKQAYAAASANTNSNEEMVPLKCCLMSVSLPWEHMAYALLFKGSPPVNL